MPFPPPSRTPSGPRRRTLLASAAGAALLVGCSPGGADGGPAAVRSAVERARARASRDSLGLVARYDAVIAAHPALAERLRPLRAEVAAHAKAFADDASGAPGPANPSASASASGSASPSAPADSQGAVAALAADERALADRRAKDLLDAPGELARLLASVAAAGAAHAYLLTEGAK
ncbi:hypothetical protein [Streptomyces sp. NPDC086787]|uniref:hypothetical protein n=1 Tax=Streptomyces sp. NPDC086787 TaxID=3365759 RepID=UPI00382FE1C0